MFLILLGDAGWAALLPSENFRGFFIGTEPTADETETVLTLHSATFRGPKIVARSFTFTSSSMSSVSTVLILLSVMLMISAEFTLNTWFFRLFFRSALWSRTRVRVWKGLDMANESSDGLCCRWGELFVGIRLVRDPTDHFFSEMLFFSLSMFGVELKLSGKDFREMKVGSGCLRSTSLRETLIVAEEMVSGNGWEVSTLKVGGGEGGGVSSLATRGGFSVSSLATRGGEDSLATCLGGEEGEGGVSVSVSWDDVVDTFFFLPDTLFER